VDDGQLRSPGGDTRPGASFGTGRESSELMRCAPWLEPPPAADLLASPQQLQAVLGQLASLAQQRQQRQVEREKEEEEDEKLKQQN
jgi:hypothetical protein